MTDAPDEGPKHDGAVSEILWAIVSSEMERAALPGGILHGTMRPQRDELVDRIVKGLVAAADEKE